MLPLLIAIQVLFLTSEMPVPRQVVVGENFTLQPGGQVRVTDSLSGSIITLSLTGLTDSRCPKDVLCVQAGEVEALLLVSINEATPAQPIEIARAATPHLEDETTPSILKSRYEPAVNLGARYKLVLLQALPYPEARTSDRANQVLIRVDRTSAG